VATQPSYRHHHLRMRGDMGAVERELDRLSAEGWEVAHVAVVVSSTDEHEYVYLLRRPA